MNRYFSYEYDEDFDYENEVFDPYDYPARRTVDMMDYNYTYHFDGSAKIELKEGNKNDCTS